jgi:hypothetical protein
MIAAALHFCAMLCFEFPDLSGDAVKLVFLYGRPASGKLTVAQELSRLTGFKLFHNHLTVDLLTPVFEFGSAAFVELREAIWLSVFEHACRSSLPGLIFTFAAERTVRQQFIANTERVIRAQGGEIVFVELHCSEQELEKRMSDPSRARHGKLTSLEKYRELDAAGVFSSPTMPVPHFRVDTGLHSPAVAAEAIARILDTAKRSA